MENKQLPTIITQANTMLPKFARRLSRYNFIEEVSRPVSAELARHIIRRIEVELRRKIDEAIMNDDQKSGKISVMVPWAVEIEFSLPFESEDSPENEHLTDAIDRCDAMAWPTGRLA